MSQKIFYIFYVTLISTSLNVVHSSSKPKASCSVYDPFKVLPDNNKFQIGGAFPLHEPDCLTLIPDTVQDIVAIQWALTHWNQNPENDQAKMGLYAGDTCSRPKEAISQSLRFLDSVGYHEPDECLTERKENIPKLLSIIAPKDPNSSFALGNLLRSANLVVGTYSFSAQNAFKDLENVVGTVPTLDIYGDAMIKLMGTLRSNLVTIIDNGEDASITDSIVEQFRQAEVFVSEVVSYDHPLIATILAESDSKIVVSLLDKKKVTDLLAKKEIRAQTKIWIVTAIDEDPIMLDENSDILKEGTKIQIISLHAKRKPLGQFKDYFLRVLKSNYESYSLLTSYVQQVFNCSVEKTPGFADCSALDGQRMVELYRLAHTVEPLIRLTYAFAAVGRKLVENKQLRHANICERPSEACTKTVIQELLKLDYEFGLNDPNEFNGEKLRFYRSGNTILLNGIALEAILTVVNENGPMAYKVLEYESGPKPKVSISNLRQQLSLLRSICQPYRPYCGQCDHVVDVESEKIFLTIPKHYPLYVTGIFDFREGSKCNVLRHDDISLPMAFIHTLWTFRQRYPQLNLLPNIDFGALLIDSCSQGRNAIQSLVQMEKQCIRFEQASRNITIVPGSIFAFVSAVGSESAETIKNYFNSGESGIPAVTIDGGNNQEKNTFTTIPSHKNLAIALLKVLRQMQWEFVSVVLSAQDFDSLAAFRVFERLANDRGVCIAEVINVQGEGHHDLTAHGTNVTLMFTTARDAAAYMSGKLRHGDEYLGSTVHVLIGDAHDFYLHDRTNLAHFVGTVSVQPKDVIYSDFQQWLEMTTPLTLPEQWYWRYVEERWQCALSLSNKNLYAGKMCTGNELLDVHALGRMTRSGYLSRGLERLLFAMDAVYKRLCPEQNGVCSDFYNHGREYVQKILKNTPIEDDFDVYEFLPDHHGNFEYRPIGNWSISTGYRVITAYQTFMNGAPKSDFHHTSRCLPPMCKCFLDQDFFLKPLENQQPPSEDNSAAWSKSYVKKEPAMQYVNNDVYNSIFSTWHTGAWRSDPTNYIFLALISIFLLLALIVFVLIIVKMYFRVVKGNQSLGITLLVGIILLYFTTYFFVFDPTDLVCRCRVVLHSTAYTICFGVMITKAVQLRNAEALGFNTAHHISYWNYWLLLFFIFGVQLALNVRWVAEPFMSAWTIENLETQLICAYNKYDFLLAQAYVIILLLLALFINAQNRNIKRNYKETKWLFLASLTCVVFFVVWTILYTLIPNDYRDYVIILESLSCGTILLTFLFGPKIYILLSYEPVVVEARAPTLQNMSENKDFNLFEADEELQQRTGAISPASSTNSSTRTTRCSSLAHRCTITSSSASSCGACSDDQVNISPMFHTVMRKKKNIRRAHSEHEYKHGYTGGNLRDSEPTTPNSTTSSKRSH